METAICIDQPTVQTGSRHAPHGTCWSVHCIISVSICLGNAYATNVTMHFVFIALPVSSSISLSATATCLPEEISNTDIPISGAFFNRPLRTFCGRLWPLCGEVQYRREIASLETLSWLKKRSKRSIEPASCEPRSWQRNRLSGGPQVRLIVASLLHRVWWFATGPCAEQRVEQKKSLMQKNSSLQFARSLVCHEVKLSIFYKPHNTPIPAT